MSNHYYHGIASESVTGGSIRNTEMEHMRQTEVRLPQELTLLGSMLRMGADMTLKRVTRDVAVLEANERMKLRREMLGSLSSGKGIT